MVLELVIGPVEQGHHTHGQLFVTSRHTEISANLAQVDVPALGKRRTVQQHAVDLEQPAAAPLPNGCHQVSRLGGVCGQQWDGACFVHGYTP